MRRIGAVAAVVLVLLAISGLACRDESGKVQGIGPPSQPGDPRRGDRGLLDGKVPGVGPSSPSAPARVGLSINDPRAFPGYTLLAPMTSTTYLIDMQGKVVRTWESETIPGYSAYLLENGDLLRPGVLK